MKLIELTKGFFAMVDEDDFEEISSMSWHYQPKRQTGYAIGSIRINGKNSTRRMHRMILNAKKNEVVDHINGNGLDNRKENLRIASHKLNAINRRSKPSSGFKGVVKIKSKKDCWTARIGPRKSHVVLGYFSSKEDAAKAYDIAAIKIYGANAVTNFNKENYK